MNLVRKNILKVEAYVAGKPIEETRRELGLKSVIKLASNENPIGPSPKAVLAIKKSLSQINRYPDSQSFYLKNKLAKKLGALPSNIVLGNGSDELIDIVIKTFVEDDENIVTSENTFLEYSIIARVNNRKLTTTPLKGFKFDLPAMKERIDKKTKLIFIANPNNPTGTYVNKSELERFMDGLSEKAIVVIDEAYDTFIDVDDYPSGLGYLKGGNIIVFKTFSKAYGLAGLRLGYAVVNEKWAAFLERTRQPFNVNLLAQQAALAALDDDAFLKRTRKVVLDGKYYLYAALNKIGLFFVPSVTNFILVDVKRDCLGVFKELLKYGVIVRDMKQYRLDNFIRVTIGTEKENQKFVSALKSVLKK